ncbi:MAG: SpoIID/LytB domain-containing protein [Elusimicrobiota bacterium]
MRIEKTGLTRAVSLTGCVILGTFLSVFLARGQGVRRDAAYTAFLNGRFDDAERAYRFVDAVGVSSGDAVVNLALVLRDEGRNQAALPYWIKASLNTQADGFVFNQLGWSYLSDGNFKAARQAFLKGIARAAVLSQQAEANFGLGFTDWMDGRPSDARQALRKALLQGPYIIPAASLVMGWAAQKMKDEPAAMAYLRQSVELDPLSLEALKSYARFEQGIGENGTAWDIERDILGFDPNDVETQKMSKKTEAYLNGETQSFVPARRLATPVLNPNGGDDIAPSRSREHIRVDLFSNRDGDPATVTRLYFMSNSPFRVVSAKNGDVVADNGGAYQQWTLSFRPESDVVEVRDSQNNLVYAAKQPVRIEPNSNRGSILIKSAVFLSNYGFDPGDRELRGVLEVWPTPYGFTLLNELNLEDYLRGVVSAVLPIGSHSEADKTQAVAARSTAYWFKAHPPVRLERADICDSQACQQYLGVTAEMHESSLAVKKTSGIVLLGADGKPARAWEHVDCGGRTENGSAFGVPELVSVDDSSHDLAPIASPEGLERWTHGFPSADDYGEQTRRFTPAASRWVRIISAKTLMPRIERIKYIGALRHLKVLRRSSTGRVVALEADGSRGTVQINGEKAVGEFLSPGTLRSALFTIQPIMDGRNASYFILWGAGTGSGLGLCEAGTIGQAAIGKDWRQILAFYFPKFKIGAFGRKNSVHRAQSQIKARRRSKNPRWRRAQ